MSDLVKKICLYVIYFGIGLVLFSPILIDHRLFYPFITTKVFLFRIIVEILLLGYLILNLVSSEYRPRWNKLTIFLVLFIAVAFAASALGDNFYLSFWGDIERGEGLLLWLHLLAFFVILTGTVKTRAAWAALLDFALGSSMLLALFGLGQALKVETLLATSGDRVDSTLGNPAFFATYLLLNIGIALFLMTLRQSKVVRSYYAGVIVFYCYLIFATQTRGAILGLAVGLVVGAGLVLRHHWKNKALRRAGIGLILAVIVCGGALRVFRQSDFIKHSFLNRVANVSLESRTVETRLATWSAVWSGIKEKPFLGWGLENFNVVFNKNFPPIIYEDEGSQVWFDRAHNVIFDRAVTTGVFGLVLFLGFLLYPAYYLVRYSLRNPESRNAAIIVASLTVAYFVQDLFIFETAVIYMSLFFMWAFLSVNYLPQQMARGWSLPRWGIVGIVIVYAAVLGPILWQANLKPLQVNMAAASVLQATRVPEPDFFALMDQFKAVLSSGTYGRQEYRVQIVEWADGQMSAAGELSPEARPFLEYFDDQVARHIDEDPNNAQNYLLAMRHYNYTYAALPDKEVERLEKGLSFYTKLAELSPLRPQVHQEAAYSHFYLYRYFKGLGDIERAGEEARIVEELFEKTVEINPRVVESYINLIVFYLNTGDDQNIRRVIDLMDERRVIRAEVYLTRLANIARANQNLFWYGFFSEEQVKLTPDDDDVEAWIRVAVFYATSGDRTRALVIAEKIKSFGGDYVRQAESFIESVNRGEYEKPK